MPRPPDLSTASDRDVVRAARRGSEDAFRELVRRYRRRVHRSIYGIVHHTERTKDLGQETFVRAFGALDRYRSDRRFAPWLFTIARNAARDYVARIRPDSGISPRSADLRYLDRVAIAVPAPGEAPTPEPDAHPRALALDRALGRLRPEYRRCVMLRFVEQRSYDEIAAIMRLPLGTVKSHLSRARKQMKRYLEPAPA